MCDSFPRKGEEGVSSLDDLVAFIPPARALAAAPCGEGTKKTAQNNFCHAERSEASALLLVNSIKGLFATLRMTADKDFTQQSLGSCRVTVITRPPVDVKNKVIFKSQARGLQIVVACGQEQS